MALGKVVEHVIELHAAVDMMVEAADKETHAREQASGFSRRELMVSNVKFEGFWFRMGDWAEEAPRVMKAVMERAGLK